MATLRKRGGKWQAQVRRLGYKPTSRTFVQKQDAVAWARQKEIALDRGEPGTLANGLKELTIGGLLRRYRQSITPIKRSAPIERYRIAVILRHDIARIRASELTAAHISAYRDLRLEAVAGETARKDLILLNHLFVVARRDWGLRFPHNPVAEVQKPPPCRARTRRLEPEELKRLHDALTRSRNSVLGHFIRFAIETGMRRGEMLRMEWIHLDLKKRTLHIGETKNGHPRTIPLSSTALAILECVRGLDPDRVFPTTASAMRQAWVRLVCRARIPDLRFHDLRHEAISRLFEKGLSVPQVALISGHRDPRMLFRYTHLRAEDIAPMLG